MKLLIVGYGKMGQLVDELAAAQGLEVSGRIDVDKGDWSAPADVANIVAFLAASEPCFITGQEFVVDGFQFNV